MVGVDLAGGILADHPIGSMTTYRAGGRAARFVRPVDRSELEAVAAGVASAGIPVLIVGRGSNLLVADAGFGGLALQLGQAFEKVRAEGTTVVAGAGVSLPVLARRTVAESLTGFEWAVGVPGLWTSNRLRVARDLLTVPSRLSLVVIRMLPFGGLCVLLTGTSLVKVTSNVCAI